MIETSTNVKNEYFYKCGQGLVFAKYVENILYKVLIINLIHLKAYPCHN